MKAVANAMEDRVLDVSAARLIELEGWIKQQLMGQLLVGHTPRKSSVGATTTTTVVVATSGNVTSGALGVKGLERLSAGDLLQLAPEAVDLGAELDLELGVHRLVWRQMRLCLVERDKRVLDTARELGLVWDLPRLEALEVFEEHRRKVLGDVVRHIAEDTIGLLDGIADAMELDEQRGCRLKQLVLKVAHAFEDMRRLVGDHVAREEDAHVDVFGGKGLARGAMAKCAQQVHTLEAGLASSDDVLLSKHDHQILKAAIQT